MGTRLLTAEQIREIRVSTCTHAELAALYGVTQWAIGKIRRWLTYKDVAP